MPSSASMDTTQDHDKIGANSTETSPKASLSRRIKKAAEYHTSQLGEHAPPPLKFLWYFLVLMVITPIYAVLGDPDGDCETGNTICMIFFSEDAEPRPLFVASTIAGVLFGVIHCLAWNFSFPSIVEQVMWRTASLSVVGACMVATFSVFLFTDPVVELHGRLPEIVVIIVGVFYAGAFGVFIATPVIYPIARMTQIGRAHV